LDSGFNLTVIALRATPADERNLGWATAERGHADQLKMAGHKTLPGYPAREIARSVLMTHHDAVGLAGLSFRSHIFPVAMSRAAKTIPPKDFESAVTELEGLVATMEAGNLPLEQSLAAYKRGVELSAFCQRTLADAEQQVKILENGLLKDFDPDSQADMV
jgi:exodeoxyribonuclease VII small subunit